MIIIIVFLIAFLASVIGSIAGIGGGVIIKPIFDALQLFPPNQIAIYSSVTVFAMASSSLVQSILKRVKIDYILGLKIFVGATIGGFIGSNLLSILSNVIGESSYVTAIQSATLIFFLLLSIMMVRFKDSLNIAYFNKSIFPVFVGMLLGTIASFLSIGGGPINVAFISVLLGFGIKQSVLYSILAIFFSQASNLTLAIFDGGFSGIDPTTLIFAVFGGISGGLIGTKIGTKISDASVKAIFYISLVGIILLNVYVIFISI